MSETAIILIAIKIIAVFCIVDFLNGLNMDEMIIKRTKTYTVLKYLITYHNSQIINIITVNIKCHIATASRFLYKLYSAKNVTSYIIN